MYCVIVTLRIYNADACDNYQYYVITLKKFKLLGKKCFVILSQTSFISYSYQLIDIYTLFKLKADGLIRSTFFKINKTASNKTYPNCKSVLLYGIVEKTKKWQNLSSEALTSIGTLSCTIISRGVFHTTLYKTCFQTFKFMFEFKLNIKNNIFH